jgi:AcrR family transcriptional regulator
LIRGATLKLVGEKGCASLTFEDLMRETGLSKGAIFHHVSGKSELLAIALDDLLVKTDRSLDPRLSDPGVSLDELVREFRDGFAALGDPRSPETRILKYLLSREDEPEVARSLSRFLDAAVAYSRKWIESGVRAGLFAPSTDSGAAAALIVTVNFGIRMSSGVVCSGSRVGAGDFADFMVAYLKGGSK